MGSVTASPAAAAGNGHVCSCTRGECWSPVLWQDVCQESRHVSCHRLSESAAKRQPVIIRCDCQNEYSGAVVRVSAL